MIMIFGSKFQAILAEIGKTQIWQSKEQKLLGVDTESHFNFDKFVITLCKKARKKLSALARLSHFLKFDSKKKSK